MKIEGFENIRLFPFLFLFRKQCIGEVETLTSQFTLGMFDKKSRCSMKIYLAWFFCQYQMKNGEMQVQYLTILINLDFSSLKSIDASLWLGSMLIHRPSAFNWFPFYKFPAMSIVHCMVTGYLILSFTDLSLHLKKAICHC